MGTWEWNASGRWRDRQSLSRRATVSIGAYPMTRWFDLTSHPTDLTYRPAYPPLFHLEASSAFPRAPHVIASQRVCHAADDRPGRGPVWRRLRSPHAVQRIEVPGWCRTPQLS